MAKNLSETVRRIFHSVSPGERRRRRLKVKRRRKPRTSREFIEERAVANGRIPIIIGENPVPEIRGASNLPPEEE